MIAEPLSPRFPNARTIHAESLNLGFILEFSTSDDATSLCRFAGPAGEVHRTG
ncbi:MAG: hypothetical protein IPP82_09865 [Xanthomonadales bacterium]|nr:hypothetical protein [Xanthomonadales bacterium]